MKVIQVTYHRETNRLPARFIAEDTTGLKNHKVIVKVESYPTPEHAAIELRRKMQWTNALVGGRLSSHKYVFVLLDDGWIRKGE